jgi:hypothetical protein
MARLAREVFDDDPTRRLTPLTRREIFGYMRTEGGPWWGRLDEIGFELANGPDEVLLEFLAQATAHRGAPFDPGRPLSGVTSR